MAKNIKKSHKDRYKERYKTMYPDLDVENEDALYESANSGLDELEGYRKNNSALIQAFDNNKAFASMLMAAKDGKDPFEWLAENLGADISELISNPEYSKKIAAAAKKFNDNQSTGEATKKEYEKNVEESLKALQTIQAETGWSNEQCYDLASKVYDIIGDGQQGIIKPETFRLVMNGSNYDTDLSDAKAEGEVKGRNTKISEQLKKDTKPNGVPPTLSTAKGGSMEKPKKKSFWEGTV